MKREAAGQSGPRALFDCFERAVGPASKHLKKASLKEEDRIAHEVMIHAAFETNATSMMMRVWLRSKFRKTKGLADTIKEMMEKMADLGIVEKVAMEEDMKGEEDKEEEELEPKGEEPPSQSNASQGKRSNGRTVIRYRKVAWSIISASKPAMDFLDQIQVGSNSFPAS